MRADQSTRVWSTRSPHGNLCTFYARPRLLRHVVTPTWAFSIATNQTVRRGKRPVGGGVGERKGDRKTQRERKCARRVRKGVENWQWCREVTLIISIKPQTRRCSGFNRYSVARMRRTYGELTPESADSFGRAHCFAFQLLLYGFSSTRCSQWAIFGDRKRAVFREKGGETPLCTTGSAPNSSHSPQSCTVIAANEAETSSSADGRDQHGVKREEPFYLLTCKWIMSILRLIICSRILWALKGCKAASTTAPDRKQR